MTALLCRQTRIKTLRLGDCEAHQVIQGDTVLAYDLERSTPSFRRVVMFAPAPVHEITIEVTGAGTIILPSDGEVLDGNCALVKLSDYPDVLRGFCPLRTNRPALKPVAAYYEGGDAEGYVIEWTTSDYLWTGGVLSGRSH